jgi:uroporphyrinogen-III synthase
VGAELLPLEGVGVAVTRQEEPTGALTTFLQALGARVVPWGSIAFAPPEDPAPFLDALVRLESYHWICFSSPRAVESVVRRAAAPPPGVRMAAVGPSTATALASAGWPVDRLPAHATGEGLVEAFRLAGDAAGARVFFPASAIARETIPAGLRALGAVVERITAYRTVALPLDREACRRQVEGGEVQVVTFTSPSAMEGLRAGLGEDLFRSLAGSVPAAAMGPTTAASLEGMGWKRVVVAGTATMEGLARAAAKAAAGAAERGGET